MVLRQENLFSSHFAKKNQQMADGLEETGTLINVYVKDTFSL